MKKSTKVELVSAIAMLLVAAIMMTSASFAWFTLSTTPEVSGVPFDLGASKNFEIARVTVDGTYFVKPDEVTSNDAIEGTDKTWGAKVTTFPGVSSESKLTYGVKIADGSTIKNPAGTAIDKGSLTQIAYAADGRTSGAYIALNTTSGALNNGVQTISAFVKDGMDGGFEKNVGVGYAVWLRSNTTVSSLKVEVVTKDAVAAYRDNTGTLRESQVYLPATNGAVGSADNKAAKVGDALSISVRLFAKTPQANSVDSWKVVSQLTKDSAASAIVDGSYISLAGDGTTIDLTSYAGFKMAPNTEYMAVIVISIDGEYIYARSFTENGLTVSGYSVKFSTDDVPEATPIS